MNLTGWNDRTNTSYQCREEFETWAKANGFEIVRMMSMDAYFSGKTDTAWNEWQRTWKPKEAPHAKTD